jgi:pimeloyl-ACP methyl ester carboxylesterase
VDSAHVRQFVQTHLLPLWPRIASPRCWPSSASLSPAGRLENISAAVTLLHSSDDVLVPADHAARNYAELCQRRSGKQSILCTPLLEHVAPRWSQSWRDVPALVSAFADLL